MGDGAVGVAVFYPARQREAHLADDAGGGIEVGELGADDGQTQGYGVRGGED